MKKILFAAGITIIGLSAAFAQDVKQQSTVNSAKAQPGTATVRTSVKTINPEQLAQKKTDRLNQVLTLTEAQKKSIHDIFLKDAEQNQGRAIQRKEIDEQIKTVLTAEQLQQYESMKKQRQQMIMQQRQQRSELKASPANEK